MTKIEWNCGKCFLVPQHKEIISCAMWFISIPHRAKKKSVSANPKGLHVYQQEPVMKQNLTLVTPTCPDNLLGAVGGHSESDGSRHGFS